jgi:predicted alpha/beta-fold hydrolase
MTINVSHHEFKPHPWLLNPHAMTVAPAFFRRTFGSGFQNAGKPRLFKVSEDTQLAAHCHFQKEGQTRPTVVVLHGLEGSSDSAYVLGVADKAFSAGMNAVRLNMRNCGNSMHLTPTLYNGGLSSDLISVVDQLASESSAPIFLVGFSLGGNVVLKAAGELGQRSKSVAAVAGVSPAIDLDWAVQAIELPKNRFYEQWFLQSLKKKVVQKKKLYPALYDLSRLPAVQTLRMFDDVYTAPNGGYGNAASYYHKASSRRVLSQIEIPSLVIAAEDDPLVPFGMFRTPEMSNPNVRLMSTEHGGHAGFVQKSRQSDGDRFWAENRIVEFFGQFATPC